jgi:hypothetical protein
MALGKPEARQKRIGLTDRYKQKVDGRFIADLYAEVRQLRSMLLRGCIEDLYDSGQFWASVREQLIYKCARVIPRLVRCQRVVTTAS